MKNLILISFTALVFAISCSNDIVDSEKPLTGNIPSLDKNVLTGSSVSTASMTVGVAAATDVVSAGAAETLGSDITLTDNQYSALQRLYDTVWYKTEKDYDDGVLEEETEFIFFNSDGTSMKEVEVENGIVEKPEEDDYGTVSDEQSLTTDTLDDNYNANASVFKRTTTENGRTEVDYIAVYLYDENTLFIVDEDTESEAIDEITDIISNPTSGTDNKYILSTESDLNL